MKRENSQNKKFAQQNDPLDSAVKMLHGAERKKTQHKEAPQKIKGDQELVPQSHCHSEVSVTQRKSAKRNQKTRPPMKISLAPHHGCLNSVLETPGMLSYMNLDSRP